MRFVPIKSAEQQGVMVLHRMREGFKEERTACTNRIRDGLAEFDRVFGKSPKVLSAVLSDVIEDASNELTGLARIAVQQAYEHWRALDERMRGCDQQIGAHVRSSPAAQRAAKINGIGEIGASALTAGVGDFKQFKSGQQFGAWWPANTAEGLRGHGQQERTHPVGGDDARAGLLGPPRQRQAAGQVRAGEERAGQECQAGRDSQVSRPRGLSAAAPHQPVQPVPPTQPNFPK